MTTKVLIVDDEPLVRTGLRAVIDAEPDLAVVGEAGDGAEVVPLAGSVRPDVVLMDVRMPSIDGIRATELLLARGDPAPKVLVVTTFENDDYVYDALRAGASGFVLKRVGPEQIADAVRVVAHGDSLLFPEAIRRLAAHHSSAAQRQERSWSLTEREAEVLRLVASGANNAEMAARLFISTETVKTHVTSVLTKLGARDRTQAVIEAYESGFMRT